MWRLVILLVFALSISNGEEKYTTKYDNIDLENAVKNDRLMKMYVDCLLERGKCTPDGLELKKNINDAFENDCSKCSKKQKEGADFVIHHLYENKKDDWDELEKKYDPEGIYQKKYFAKEA